MEMRTVKELLEGGIAFLPGSRDRLGCPVVIFPQADGQHRYEDVVATLGYLAQIPDDQWRRGGFCVLVDARRGNGALKTILRACQHALYRCIRRTLIVQPEKFLDKQKLHFDLLVDAYDFKVSLVSLHKVSRYVDVTQLPYWLGGTYPYDHQHWMQTREHYERFLTDGSAALRVLQDGATSPAGRLSRNSTTDNTPSPDETLSDDSCGAGGVDELLRSGQELLARLGKFERADQHGGFSDSDAARRRVETLLRQLREAQEANSGEKTATATNALLLDQFMLGVDNLLEWLLGPGERWLLALHEIGESKDEALQLCKEHEHLDVRAQEIVAQANDLCELAKQLQTVDGGGPRVQQKLTDMHSVCRNFLDRIKRQTAIVKSSVQCHQLRDEYSKELDGLVETLCSDAAMNSTSECDAVLATLDQRVSALDGAQSSFESAAEELAAELQVVERNGLGRELTRDYAAGVVHVRQLLADGRQRRRRCNDLLDVRRLRLQQLTQLHTCERDCRQAITWLDELCETLRYDFAELPSDKQAVAVLKRDLSSLEQTARSTFEYGKQLTQVSLVLRRSVRLDVGGQLRLQEEVEAAWAAFCRAYSEQMARISIGCTFHNTVNEVNNRLKQLCSKVETEMTANGDGDTSADSKRRLERDERQLNGEVCELRHMARALIDTEPPLPHGGRSQFKLNATSPNAAHTIQSQIDQVLRNQRELEHAWKSA